MLKKISLFSVILLFTFMNPSFAHTHLESSTPKNDEVINEALKQIILTFGGKIEQGSTFTVQKTNGESVNVNNITVNENVLSGDLPTPLENGDYTVEWSIIGEDGHLIEDNFSFTLNPPATETVKESEIIMNENVPKGNDYEENPSENKDAVQNEGNSYAFPITIGVFILIFIIGFAFLGRRKK